MTEQEQLNRKMIEAFNWGELEKAKDLLGAGADIEAKDNIGWTALHYVSWNGDLKAVKELLGRGANLEAKNNTGWTALHLAAATDKLEIVKELLERGTDINVRDKDGWNALHLAASNGNLEIVKELLKAGVELGVVTNGCKTSLDLASRNFHVEIVKELIEAGEIVTSLHDFVIYPKKAMISVHNQMKQENEWYSALFFILKEKSNYNKLEYKELVLKYIEDTKMEIPENISIILNALT